VEAAVIFSLVESAAIGRAHTLKHPLTAHVPTGSTRLTEE